MPSGERYWTLLDDDLELVVAADEFLRHLRFGRDAAETTTRTYAGRDRVVPAAVVRVDRSGLAHGCGLSGHVHAAAAACRDR
jgi:hypothetical protein